MKTSQFTLLVIGVGGAGERIVGHWRERHTTAEKRFCVGLSEPAEMERAVRVVVVVGLGGRAGGPRALLEVTRAKARGVPTTVLAIWPFTFEGRKRWRQAQTTLDALREAADALRVFNNDGLLDSDDEALDLESAYRACDDKIWESVSVISG